MPQTFSLLTHENHKRKNLEQNTNKKTLEKKCHNKKRTWKDVFKKTWKKHSSVNCKLSLVFGPGQMFQNVGFVVFQTLSTFFFVVACVWLQSATVGFCSNVASSLLRKFQQRHLFIVEIQCLLQLSVANSLDTKFGFLYFEDTFVMCKGAILAPEALMSLLTTADPYVKKPCSTRN